jgi:cysteinyl-tRNA synthetase
MRRILLALVLCGCSSSTEEAPVADSAGIDDTAITDSSTSEVEADSSPATDTFVDGAEAAADAMPTSKRGFPEIAPWVSFYGTAAEMGALGKVADTFRVINIDVDPDGANFTKPQIATLRAGGKNRVISYMNVGSCENYRSYWDTVPTGFVSCKANTKAQRGAYDGYPDETWMDVGDADYQKLIVEHVAPRLMGMGVDGFFLDNLEIVEHGTSTSNGPCNAACAQGGLDLVRMLREKFPDALIVMQNATSDVTRKGKTGGLDFPSLLDGISHEEVYAPTFDSSSEAELTAWKGMGLAPGGRKFFIGTEDYVGNCTASAKAQSAYDKSRAKGFSPYATDESAGQKVVCYWPF